MSKMVHQAGCFCCFPQDTDHQRTRMDDCFPYEIWSIWVASHPFWLSKCSEYLSKIYQLGPTWIPWWVLLGIYWWCVGLHQWVSCPTPRTCMKNPHQTLWNRALFGHQQVWIWMQRDQILGVHCMSWRGYTDGPREDESHPRVDCTNHSQRSMRLFRICKLLPALYPKLL